MPIIKCRPPSRMQPGSQMGSLGVTQPGTGGMQMSPAGSRGKGNSAAGRASSRGIDSPGPQASHGGGRPLPPPSNSTRAGPASFQQQQLGLGPTAPSRQEQQRQGVGRISSKQDNCRRVTSDIDLLLEGMMSDDDDGDNPNVCTYYILSLMYICTVRICTVC